MKDLFLKTDNKKMSEKFIGATQTQVATKVSTKTKVLLGIVMIFALAGMFGIASMGISSKNKLKKIQPTQNFIPTQNATSNIPRDVDPWTQCTNNNNYCGTITNFAQAKDNNTNLVWAYPCVGSLCNSHTGYLDFNAPPSYLQMPTYYGILLENSSSVTKLCNELGDGWRLPTKEELLGVYANGACGVLEDTDSPSGSPVNYEPLYYWSSTPHNDILFSVSICSGMIANNFQSRPVRCVKEMVPPPLPPLPPIATTTTTTIPLPPDDKFITCTQNHDFCGTNSDFAEVEDVKSGKIWSHACIGPSCDSHTGDGNTSDSIDQSLATYYNEFDTGNGFGVLRLCKNGWRVPTKEELVEAYNGGICRVLSRIPANNFYYWSSFTSQQNDIRFFVNICNGTIENNPGESGPYGPSAPMRCVRNAD